MNTTMQDTRCPHCGRTNEKHDSVGHDEPPSEGALSLCMGCAGWGVFTEDGGMRMPNAKELAEIEAAPECRAARAALLLVRGKRRP